MTPAEHYVEAQRLLREADLVAPEDPPHARTMVAAAQVHATLATVAQDTAYRAAARAERAAAVERITGGGA